MLNAEYIVHMCMYTHPKWKLYTVYTGIYYTGDKKQQPVPPNAGNEIQSFVGMFW